MPESPRRVDAGWACAMQNIHVYIVAFGNAYINVFNWHHGK